MAFAFTDENFQTEALDATLPVMVDFYADWCGPCKMMGPVVEQLAKDYDGKVKIGKLDVDKAGAIAQKYKVMSIPTILIFKNGQVVDTIVGAVPKQQLEAKIQAVL